MNNFKQQIADEFEQYQLLSTAEERQAFWGDVEKRTNSLTPDQRLAAQKDVRQNAEQILRRMETIAQQLTVTANA